MFSNSNEREQLNGTIFRSEKLLKSHSTEGFPGQVLFSIRFFWLSFRSK